MILKNTESFKINVINTQTIDGEKNSVIESAVCSYRRSNGKYYIAYQTSDSKCMIKLDDRGITVTRLGDSSAKMSYEPGKHRDFLYNTPYGTLKMTVFTKFISHTLHENGGTIHMDYVLDTNGDKLYNNMFIKIER